MVEIGLGPLLHGQVREIFVVEVVTNVRDVLGTAQRFDNCSRERPGFLKRNQEINDRPPHTHISDTGPRGELTTQTAVVMYKLD